jgi:hypothetical protein
MNFQQLRETMMTAAPWEIVDDDTYKVIHDTDDIQVRFSEEDDLTDENNYSAMEIVFDVNGTMFPRNKRESSISPYVLFGTVLAIVKEHQRKHGYELYIYHPSNNKLGMIYKKMIKRFLPRDWGTTEWDNRNGWNYIVLYKKS